MFSAIDAFAPTINNSSLVDRSRNQFRTFSSSRQLKEQANIETLTDVLPICCPGCGAFSQTIEPDEPGYYSASRKQTRKLLASKREAIEQSNAADDATSTNTEQGDLGEDAQPTPPIPMQGGALPDDAVVPDNYSLQSPSRVIHVCDRCHDLIHHNKAVSSPKPSVHSIRDFMNESPYKNNRVYHILDAADFPMSLIPRIHWALYVQEQRSKNRRSANEKYRGGKKMPTLSFIITRSDLLAATKEQVDSKMEYVRDVLRDALGKAGRDVRLGNVHMISAHRGWWTKQVKEEIKEHGGGIWVVGKANVGKSSFIEACFPKDSRTIENMAEWIERQREEQEVPNQRQASLLDPDSLLPPAPREEVFPVLPVVSSMPGTTVSPIRIPFGRGKGEVIDLPGLERGELEDYVRDEHKRDLIMTKRVKPNRCTIKPGQSLLLGGGLVRITAVDPEDTILAACFIPIESHVTKTEKAIEVQTEQRPYAGTVLMNEGTGKTIASAGKFDLKWDTTASNLPSTIAKAVKDKGIPIPRLPYRVMSADILVEGCGWVEVSIQIRTKRNTGTEAETYPQIEVFTPNGKHVDSRPPIECWNFIAEKLKADKRKRPRLRHRYS
ncbi:mitochondrial ribosome small subunit bioproteinsis protein [Penicillium ochrochloron]